MAEHALPQCVEEINRICMDSDSTDVYALAQELLKGETIRLHGPEHHYLISSVLITTYCNGTGKEDQKEELLEKALLRANDILPGTCGFYGVCGGVMAVGSAISIIEKITPYKREALKELSQITLKCQTQTASYTGPRCCKRSTFAVLDEAVEWLEEVTGLKNNSIFLCSFSDSNKTCLWENCKYYSDDNSVEQVKAKASCLAVK